MKALFCVLPLVFMSCQGHKQNSETTPDAVRDLLIDRAFWTTRKTEGAVAKDTNIHRFSITNTSHQYTYSHIEVRFDYFDNDHHKISSSTRIINRAVEPRAAIKIDSLKADLTKSGTTAATTTVVSASATQN